MHISTINVPTMYQEFKKIDGTHPWRDVSPHGFIDYPIRYREGGRVLYFNFDLARELGLIPGDHPDRMNTRLEHIILKTFSLQVVNEYDQTFKTKAYQSRIKEREYMATRYLQSQHQSKSGKTSGDGRSIWNGCLRAKRLTFDISSCGTGATILSPGAQEAKRLIRTGDDYYGYASGMADLSDMLAAAVMSEIFYRRGVPTERCLTVIGYKDDTSVGVRTAPNLIRPAHLFRYLKSGCHRELKASFDYFLSRQEENGFWKLPPSGRKRYENTLKYFARLYAKLSAVLEEEYIFNWLAWDGDNMLASGALLDYGSIRQFAARHDKYRYEDNDRFSTSLTEQKYWAKRTVQTFAQAVDFIVTGKKKRLERFAKHPSLVLFDRQFVSEQQSRMLWRTGFTQKQISRLMNDHQDKVQAFRSALNYFEEIKTVKGQKEVADGINHPPVFLIRHILRELPLFLLENYKRSAWPLMEAERFCKIMAGSYVNRQDLSLTETRRERAVRFQQLYKDLILACSRSPKQVLKNLVNRSSVINYKNRSTGDGLLDMIEQAMKAKDQLDCNQFQKLLKRFIESQVLIPGEWKAIHPRELKGSSLIARYLKRFQESIELYHDMI